MTIKEAEKLSGVSSRNIRFYEQKGLLTPVRNRENDYREYSDGDIERLRLIRALRMVDMPLEQIKRIVDGEVSMQEAVAQQKSELKSKIKQIETAVHFCDELEKVDELGVEEVLMHMDEPENRKFLSKKWPTDYAETAKRILIPLGAGLVPLLFSLLLYIPVLLAGAFAHGYLFVLCPVILLCWVWLGKRLYSEDQWIGNAFLFAVFPVFTLLFLLKDGPMEWVGAIFPSGNELSQLYFLHYLVPLEAFTYRFEIEKWHYLVFFAINMGCFGLGMILRWKSAGKKDSYLQNIFDDQPILFLVIVVVLSCFLLIAPFYVMDLGPHYFDPVLLQDNYTEAEDYLAQTEEGTVWFEITEDFVKIAQFDQWERKYLRIFGVNCLTIDKEQINAGADLRFYDNDCVIVHVDGWMGGGNSYSFRVPDGVVDALKAYVQEHTILEATEE